MEDKERNSFTSAVNKVTSAKKSSRELQQRWKNVKFKVKAGFGQKMNKSYINQKGGQLNFGNVEKGLLDR